MERMMLVFLIFAAVLWWTGGVHTANSCSSKALLTCTNILASTASGQMALRMYSKQELDTLCSREFVAVKKCLQPLKADCDVSIAVVVDAFVDTLQFMCSDIGKHGYAEHGECLKQKSIQTALHQCFLSHQQQSQSTTVSAHDYAKVMCGLNVEYTTCLQRVVEPRCGIRAAHWILAMSAADNKAVSHMLGCDHNIPTETQEILIKRNTDIVGSLEQETPATNVGCSWKNLNLCRKPLEQLTVKTLDKVCRSGLSYHTECMRKVKPLCSPGQLEIIDMDVRAVTAACQLYIKGGNNHRKCWKLDAVQSAMTVCASTHHLPGNTRTTGSGDEGSGGSGDVVQGEWCRTTQAFLDCVVKATESFCPPQTGQWIWKTMARILQPNTAYLKCQFGYHSSATSTITPRMPIMTSLKPRVMPSAATVTSQMAISMSSAMSTTHMPISPTPKTMASTRMTISSLPSMKTSTLMTSSTLSVTSSTSRPMWSTPTATVKPSMTSSPQDVISATADMISPSLRWKSSTPRTTSTLASSTLATALPSMSTTAKPSTLPATSSTTPSKMLSMAGTTSLTPNTKSSTLSVMSSTPITMSSMPSKSSSSDLTTLTHKSVPNLGSLEEEVDGSRWSIVLGGAVGVGVGVLVVGLLCICVFLCQKLCKIGLPRDTESVASLHSNCESMAYSDKSSTVTHADYCQARDGSVMLTIPQFSF